MSCKLLAMSQRRTIGSEQEVISQKRFDGLFSVWLTA
jgi:hypothetical protein